MSGLEMHITLDAAELISSLPDGPCDVITPDTISIAGGGVDPLVNATEDEWVSLSMAALAEFPSPELQNLIEHDDISDIFSRLYHNDPSALYDIFAAMTATDPTVSPIHQFLQVVPLPQHDPSVHTLPIPHPSHLPYDALLANEWVANATTGYAARRASSSTTALHRLPLPPLSGACLTPTSSVASALLGTHMVQSLPALATLVAGLTADPAVDAGASACDRQVAATSTSSISISATDTSAPALTVAGTLSPAPASTLVLPVVDLADPQARQVLLDGVKSGLIVTREGDCAFQAAEVLKSLLNNEVIPEAGEGSRKTSVYDKVRNLVFEFPPPHILAEEVIRRNSHLWENSGTKDAPRGLEDRTHTTEMPAVDRGPVASAIPQDVDDKNDDLSSHAESANNLSSWASSRCIAALTTELHAARTRAVHTVPRDSVLLCSGVWGIYGDADECGVRHYSAQCRVWQEQARGDAGGDRSKEADGGAGATSMHATLTPTPAPMSAPVTAQISYNPLTFAQCAAPRRQRATQHARGGSDSGGGAAKRRQDKGGVPDTTGPASNTASASTAASAPRWLAPGEAVVTLPLPAPPRGPRAVSETAAGLKKATLKAKWAHIHIRAKLSCILEQEPNMERVKAFMNGTGIKFNPDTGLCAIPQNASTKCVVYRGIIPPGKYLPEFSEYSDNSEPNDRFLRFLHPVYDVVCEVNVDHRSHGEYISAVGDASASASNSCLPCANSAFSLLSPLPHTLLQPTPLMAYLQQQQHVHDLLTQQWPGMSVPTFSRSEIPGFVSLLQEDLRAMVRKTHLQQQYLSGNLPISPNSTHAPENATEFSTSSASPSLPPCPDPCLHTPTPLYDKQQRALLTQHLKKTIRASPTWSAAAEAWLRALDSLLASARSVAGTLQAMSQLISNFDSVGKVLAEATGLRDKLQDYIHTMQAVQHSLSTHNDSDSKINDNQSNTAVSEFSASAFPPGFSSQVVRAILKSQTLCYQLQDLSSATGMLGSMGAGATAGASATALPDAEHMLVRGCEEELVYRLWVYCRHLRDYRREIEDCIATHRQNPDTGTGLSSVDLNALLEQQTKLTNTETQLLALLHNVYIIVPAMSHIRTTQNPGLDGDVFRDNFLNYIPKSQHFGKPDSRKTILSCFRNSMGVALSLFQRSTHPLLPLSMYQCPESDLGIIRDKIPKLRQQLDGPISIGGVCLSALLSHIPPTTNISALTELSAAQRQKVSMVEHGILALLYNGLGYVISENALLGLVENFRVTVGLGHIRNSLLSQFRKQCQHSQGVKSDKQLSIFGDVVIPDSMYIGKNGRVENKSCSEYGSEQACPDSEFVDVLHAWGGKRWWEGFTEGLGISAKVRSRNSDVLRILRKEKKRLATLFTSANPHTSISGTDIPSATPLASDPAPGAARYSLVVNGDVEEVLAALQRHHSNSWISPALATVWRHMAARGTLFTLELRHGQVLLAADICHPVMRSIYVATRYSNDEFRNLQPGFILGMLAQSVFSRYGFLCYDFGGVDGSLDMLYKHELYAAEHWTLTQERIRKACALGGLRKACAPSGITKDPLASGAHAATIRPQQQLGDESDGPSSSASSAASTAAALTQLGIAPLWTADGDTAPTYTYMPFANKHNFVLIADILDSIE